MNKIFFESKKDILERLIILDKKLESRFPLGKRFTLVLVGGAALILKYNLPRVTTDIDSFNMAEELRNYLNEIGLDVFGINDKCTPIIMYHPDYDKRLEKVVINYDFKFLDIFIMSDYDLIITKIGRGTKKDFDDIAQSGMLESINKEKLEKLMDEAISYQIGQERIRINWDIFKEHHF